MARQKHQCDRATCIKWSSTVDSIKEISHSPQKKICPELASSVSSHSLKSLRVSKAPRRDEGPTTNCSHLELVHETDFIPLSCPTTPGRLPALGTIPISRVRQSQPSLESHTPKHLFQIRQLDNLVRIVNFAHPGKSCSCLLRL
jgi:hypothetical protein